MKVKSPKDRALWLKKQSERVVNMNTQSLFKNNYRVKAERVPLRGGAAVVRGYARPCLRSDKWLRSRNRQMEIRLFKYCGICKIFVVKRTSKFTFSTLCALCTQGFWPLSAKYDIIYLYSLMVYYYTGMRHPLEFLLIYSTWITIRRTFKNFTVCEVCTRYCQKYLRTCFDRRVNFSDVSFLNHKL